ncbi:hypothetical protein [Lysinibacillus sphaericus]|nr:hypothetical protein [Lysinibacillus sphaericus]
MTLLSEQKEATNLVASPNKLLVSDQLTLRSYQVQIHPNKSKEQKH